MNELLGEILAATAKNKVIVHLHPESRIPYINSPSLSVNGYFVDRPKPVLGVATGNPTDQWIETLVHESCHMDQWAENTPVWTDTILRGGVEAVDVLDKWIQGCDYNKEMLDHCISVSMRVELDCEKRSVEKLSRFRSDLETYIKKANSYIVFYLMLPSFRSWYKKAPYEVYEVWSQLPPRFLSEENYKLLADSFRPLYYEHVLNPKGDGDVHPADQHLS